ncbi:TIGR01841 family phasin [Paraburkholderia aspalathi]|nr:TIGR01841 family phasin [Paraburkholderia aspalathi]MBK3787234.1 TIGR01841 family phasin [Paraburkholderia aspalathi]
MALSSPEQVVASQRASLDAFFELGSKFFEGVEKLVVLNAQTVKSTLAEAQASAMKAAGASAPHQWFVPQPEFVNGESTEKWSSYSRHLLDIASTTQAELAQVMQTQHNQYCSRMQSLVEEAAKNAPAGSEAAIAAWKSAISATSSLYDRLQKTQQQAAEVAQGNLSALTVTASKAVRRSVEPRA